MRLSVAEIGVIESVVDEFCTEEKLAEVTGGEDIDFITHAFPTDTGRYFEIIVLLDKSKVKFSIVNEITEDEFLDVVKEAG